MLIRTAKTADFSKIQSLFHDLFLLFPNGQREDWPYSKEGEEYLAKKIASERVFVAELNGDITGYLIWSNRQGLSFQKFKSYAEIDNMYVTELHRKKGIGKKLCAAFLHTCERDGIDIIKVESAALPETVGFYEKIGFVEERKIMILNKSHLKSTSPAQ